MSNINVETWNSVYSQGRSLLQYPDEVIVSYLAKNRGVFKKGLDIACGAGRHTFLMNEFQIEAHGLDSSESSIAFAQEKASKEGRLGCHFYNRKVQEIEFDNESFDLIIIWGLIHYLDDSDQRNLLANVKRILKNGGTLLCTLRSTLDSRLNNSKEVEPNRYLVNYFDDNTQSPKQTLMYFWDKQGVSNFFSEFQNVTMGHRIIEPLGMLENKTAHWLISAQK